MASRFNHDLLRIARQARRWSQKDLSETSQVSQGNISKIENRLIEPTSDIVEKIAKALRFPVSLFYERDRVFGLPVSVHGSGMMYRKKSSVTVSELESLEAELNLRLFHLRRMLKSTEVGSEYLLPSMSPEEFGGPEAVADLVRRSWLLPSGPIDSLVDVIEYAGCVVFPCDFSDIFVDGVTVRSPGLPPCIFINKAQPGDRQRFTLAHELGHLIMHDMPTPQMEEEANAFASAFLMPDKDIRPYFSNSISLQTLAYLKPAWKVSMQSLLMRAKSLGLLSANQSQYLWKQMSALGYRREEPVELAIKPEEPGVLAEIIRVHLDDLSYSVEDLCQALHVYQDDFKKLHPLPSGTSSKGPFLTVVR